MHSEIENIYDLEQFRGSEVENKEENQNLTGISNYFEFLLASSPRLVFEVVDEKNRKTYQRRINIEIE